MDATDQEKLEFGRHKAYGIDPNPKIVKPTTGNLMLKQSGRWIVLEENKPFALLQSLKKKYITSGTAPSKIKITY